MPANGALATILALALVPAGVGADVVMPVMPFEVYAEGQWVRGDGPIVAGSLAAGYAAIVAIVVRVIMAAKKTPAEGVPPAPVLTNLAPGMCPRCHMLGKPNVPRFSYGHTLAAYCGKSCGRAAKGEGWVDGQPPMGIAVQSAEISSDPDLYKRLLQYFCTPTGSIGDAPTAGEPSIEVPLQVLRNLGGALSGHATTMEIAEMKATLLELDGILAKAEAQDTPNLDAALPSLESMQRQFEQVLLAASSRASAEYYDQQNGGGQEKKEQDLDRLCRNPRRFMRFVEVCRECDVCVPRFVRERAEAELLRPIEAEEREAKASIDKEFESPLVRAWAAGVEPLLLKLARLSSAGATTVGKCPGSHNLLAFTTDRDGFRCDACSTTQSGGSSMSGCRICDYDLCANCVGECSLAGAPTIEHEPEPPTASSASFELSPLKLGPLKRHAKALGATAEQIDGLDEVDDPKAAAIALNTSLRSGLSAMTLSGLKKHLRGLGASGAEIEEIDETGDPKADALARILRCAASAASVSPGAATTAPTSQSSTIADVAASRWAEVDAVLAAKAAKEQAMRAAMAAKLQAARQEVEQRIAKA